ncbi:alpha-tectorin-like [Chaetodon trifascialis]|uniref:alpha-tectorin-like n=1 Tax=Chaetodon trifascialis TaxID=109706 RepID=UPI00399305B6
MSPTYEDISACRESGVLYFYGDQVSSDPDTCSTEICDEYATIQPNDECGSMEHCYGNNSCFFDPICTVSGPAVIDFHGHLNDVQDRCAYTLLSTVSGLTVVGYFRERRRRDVSFLDSVTLQLDGDDDVHLEQGGIVKLGNTMQTINGLTVLSNGVEVSEDQTGVTAVWTIGNNTVSVFFDGNTAQIFLKALSGPQVDGLCANSTSVSDQRIPDNSTLDCEVLYNDPADSSINCTKMTEHCLLLNDTSFTTCHNHIDPAPYIDACMDTLCRYPAVDGLDCQFLDAYARDCSLRINDTVDSWRSMAGCSPPQPLCQGRICSDHEFCAETLSGEIGCFCRAVFAFPYKSNDTLGDPTVCEENSASVTLVGCLLEEKGIDYTILHLNDQNCTGQMDEEDHMVTFSFNSNDPCGTEVTSNNSLLIYMNTITALNSPSDNITRQDQFYIDFSCFYAQPDVNTMTFRVKDSSVIQKIISGTWNYTLTMKAYTDARHTEAVDSNTEVQLNQKIWVVLETDGLDDGLVAVVTDSCWATNQAGSLRYNLIKDGCATDQTVDVEENGKGTSSRFSFNMFQFSRSSSDVSVHCNVNLCANLNQTCVPGRSVAGAELISSAPLAGVLTGHTVLWEPSSSCHRPVCSTPSKATPWTEVVVRRRKRAPSGTPGGAPSTPSLLLSNKYAALSVSEKPAARDQHQEPVPISAASDIMPPLTDTTAFPLLTASWPPAEGCPASGGRPTGGRSPPSSRSSSSSQCRRLVKDAVRWHSSHSSHQVRDHSRGPGVGGGGVSWLAPLKIEQTLPQLSSSGTP